MAPEIVHQQLSGHLMLSLGLADRIVLFADMPYHFMIKDPTDSGAFKKSNLGDLYFGGRFNFFGTRDDLFQIGAQATLTVNTASLASSDQSFAGQADQKPYIGGWFELLHELQRGRPRPHPDSSGLQARSSAPRHPPGTAPILFVGNEFTYGGGVSDHAG